LLITLGSFFNPLVVSVVGSPRFYYSGFRTGLVIDMVSVEIKAVIPKIFVFYGVI
jgi:hypothetical protein